MKVSERGLYCIQYLILYTYSLLACCLLDFMVAEALEIVSDVATHVNETIRLIVSVLIVPYVCVKLCILGLVNLVRKPPVNFCVFFYIRKPP